MNIHNLAFFGDVKAISNLLNSSPEQANQFLIENGRRITPIFLAAVQGHIEVVRLLLKHNAQTEWPDETERFIDWVSFSPTSEKFNILALLAKEGKIKELKPLEKGYSECKLIVLQIQHLLIKTGFQSTTSPFTPRDYHVYMGELGSLSHIQSLLDDQPDPNYVEGLLEGALSGSRMDVLDLLYKNHVDLSSRFTSGQFVSQTIAYHAAWKDKVEVLRFLHKAGVNVNEPLKDGYTPAIAAIIYDRVSVLSFFLEAKVDLTQTLTTREDYGCTLAHLAIRSERVRALNMLKKAGLNLGDPAKEGPYLGQTPAHLAVQNGNLSQIIVLHELGVNLSEPIKEGVYAQDSIVRAAYLRGHSHILRYLQSIGMNVEDCIIKRFKSQDDTLAFLEAGKGAVDALKCLYEIGINLLIPNKGGYFKNANPLFIAAFGEQIAVLEFFKSELLFKKCFPAGISKEVKLKAERTYNKVTPLTPQETVALLYRKAIDHQEWFKIYRSEFFEYINHIPISIWVELGSWRQLKEIFDLYMAQGGERHDWLARAAVRYINHPKPDFEIEESIAKCSIDQLKGASRPGEPLLKLLKCVSTSDTVYSRSQVGPLEQWIKAVLKQTCTDERFWTEAKSCFEKIHSNLEPAKNKRKAPQDIFKKLWREFDTKILDSVTSPEELEGIFHIKTKESKEAVDALLKGLNQTISATLLPWSLKPPFDPLEGNVQEIEAFKARVNQLAVQWMLKWAQLNQSFRDREMQCEGIQKQSQLKITLDEIHSDKMQKAALMKDQLIREIGKLEEELKSSLSDLKMERDYRTQQIEMLAEELVLDLSDVEKIKTSIEERGRKLWEERQNALLKAPSTEELQSIKSTFDAKLETSKAQIMASLSPATQTEVSSRDLRSNAYLMQRNEALLSENKQLRKQVEQYEKKTADRPKSPEKTVPLIEKKLQVQLIEKLRPFAFSRDIKTALDMIEKEGDILTTVDEMVKFLSIFGIEYKRTTGSHKTYNSGKVNVLISNHENESAPEEVKEVLQAVLDKLNQ